MTRLRAHVLVVLAGLSAFGVPSSEAQSQVVAAQWNSMTGGNLAGVGFTSSFCCPVGAQIPFQTLGTYSFSGAAFAPAQLPAGLAPQYGSNQTIDVNFDSPVNNLLLYALQWRGSYVFPGPEEPTTYTFSQGFAILSGFVGVSPVGNTLTLPGSTATTANFFSGILMFQGPVSHLRITSNRGGSGQVMTLAAVTTVPEPNTMALMGVGVMAIVLICRRQRVN